MSEAKSPRLHSVIFKPEEFEQVNCGFHTSSRQTLEEISSERPDFACYRLGRMLRFDTKLDPLIIVQNSALGFTRSDLDGEAARIALLNTLEGELSRTRYIQPFQLVIASFTDHTGTNFYPQFDIVPDIRV